MNDTTPDHTMVSATPLIWIQTCAPDREASSGRCAAGAAQALGCEHAGQQRTDDAADAVHAEHVERVVGAEHALQAVHAPQADEAGERGR